MLEEYKIVDGTQNEAEIIKKEAKFRRYECSGFLNIDTDIEPTKIKPTQGEPIHPEILALGETIRETPEEELSRLAAVLRKLAEEYSAYFDRAYVYGRYKVSDSNSLAGIKVVLIDDSNTIRRSGEIFLSQAGCQVVLAEDGFDGLSKVVDNKPDIIFVDVMMPRLDGYQTCALIKNHREFKDTPVVMLTSKDSLFDRARGKLVGADQYLTKPFSKKSLTDAVIQHTQHKESSNGN